MAVIGAPVRIEAIKQIFRLTLLLAVLAASTAPSAQLQPSQWDAFASRVYSTADRLSADQFADAAYPAPPLEEPITVSFSDGTETGFREETDAFWTYNDGVVRLHMSGSDSSLYGRSYGLIVRSAVRPVGRYIATNAFGTRFSVQRVRRDTLAVEGRLPDRWVQDIGVTSRYDYAVSLDGADARTLIENAYVEVRFAPAGQVVTRCRTLQSGPTISSPVDAINSVCTFRADVLSVAFKRRDTLETLAMWSSDVEASSDNLVDGSTATLDQFPAAALRAGLEGTATARLTIGPDGRVARCRITQTSGHIILDRATCTRLIDGMRLAPISGETLRSVTYNMRWQLPES